VSLPKMAAVSNQNVVEHKQKGCTVTTFNFKQNSDVMILRIFNEVVLNSRRYGTSMKWRMITNDEVRICSTTLSHLL
jgi:hypothetical protein